VGRDETPQRRECLGKYLQDKHVPWMAKRRLVLHEEVVTRAHNRCSRLLQKELEKNADNNGSVRVVTADQEHTMHKLWEDEQLEKICSWERLVQTTYRAWSARQGVNGTEGLDTTRGTGVDSDEEEGASGLHDM